MDLLAPSGARASKRESGCALAVACTCHVFGAVLLTALVEAHVWSRIEPDVHILEGHNQEGV